MVASGFEFGSAGQKGCFEVGGVFDGVAECGCAEGVKVAAGGVHNDKPVGGEEAGHQAGEGGAEGCGVAITLAEEVADRGVAEEFACLFEEFVDGFVERNVADGCGRVRGFCVEVEGFDGSFSEERYLVDLFEVVVFGGEPEDGDVLDAGGGGGLGGTGDGGRSFEEGEERAFRNRPTCWPVTTARAPLRSLAMLARVSGPAPKVRDWRSRESASAAGLEVDGNGRIHLPPRGSEPYSAVGTGDVGVAFAHGEEVAKELRRVGQRLRMG